MGSLMTHLYVTPSYLLVRMSFFTLSMISFEQKFIISRIFLFSSNQFFIYFQNFSFFLPFCLLSSETRLAFISIRKCEKKCKKKIVKQTETRHASWFGCGNICWPAAASGQENLTWTQKFQINKKKSLGLVFFPSFWVGFQKFFLP